MHSSRMRPLTVVPICMLVGGGGGGALEVVDLSHPGGMGGGGSPLTNPLVGQTDACENITFAGGNNSFFQVLVLSAAVKTKTYAGTE